MPRVDRDPGVLNGRTTKMVQFVEATEIILALAGDDDLRDVVVVKTRAGYGHSTMSASNVTRSVRAMQHLAAAARRA